MIAHISLSKQPYLIQKEHHNSSHETHCVPQKTIHTSLPYIINFI